MLKKRKKQDTSVRKKKVPQIKETLKRLNINVRNYNKLVKEEKVEPAPKRFKSDKNGNLTGKMELDPDRFPDWETYLKERIIQPWDADQ